MDARVQIRETGEARGWTGAGSTMRDDHDAGMRSSRFRAVLQAAAQRTGGEIIALYVMKLIDHARRLHSGSLDRVFEIGAFNHLGLAPLFFSRGTKHVGLCNTYSINSDLDPDYVENLKFLSCLGGHEWNMDDGLMVAEGDRLVIQPDRISLFSKTPFEFVPLGYAYDFIFSMAVLEHVCDDDLSVFYNKMWDMLEPGGWMLHCIDLRDHADFKAPLGFLSLTEKEYAAGYSRENGHRRRWRDYVDGAVEHGFEILRLGYGTPFSLSVDGATDVFALITTPVDQLFPSDPSRVGIWVSEDERRRFSWPYNTLSLFDLSVTTLVLVARKPLAG